MMTNLNNSEKKITILGIGNILFSDEGIGVHLVHQLMEEWSHLEERVELVDGATDGLVLLDIVERSSHLIIIDSINAGKKPGTIIEVEQEEIPKYMGVKISLHQQSFMEVLALATMRGAIPEEMYMVGVQPLSLEWEVGLTPVVEEKLPQLKTLIQNRLQRWGVNV